MLFYVNIIPRVEIIINKCNRHFAIHESNSIEIRGKCVNRNNNNEVAGQNVFSHC